MRESNMGPLGMWGESPHIYHLFVKQQYMDDIIPISTIFGHINKILWKSN